MTDSSDGVESRGRARRLLEADATRGLTPAEQSELAVLLDRYPGVEVEGFETEWNLLGGVGDYVDVAPPDHLRDAVETSPRATPVTDGMERDIRRPSRWVLAAAAVALVGSGAIGSEVVRGLLADDPPTGPPGTLGAQESITFEGEPADVAVDASVIAHTWGTETFLDVDGLPVGDVFSVVLVEADGTELDSGTFLGAELEVTCRMNAAVLRQDVSSVEIRDATGAVVMAADLPPASG